MEDVRERDKLITNYLGTIRSLCDGERRSIYEIGAMIRKLKSDIMGDELKYPEEMHERLSGKSEDVHHKTRSDGENSE